MVIATKTPQQILVAQRALKVLNRIKREKDLEWKKNLKVA